MRHENEFDFETDYVSEGTINRKLEIIKFEKCQMCTTPILGVESGRKREIERKKKMKRLGENHGAACDLASQGVATGG